MSANTQPQSIATGASQSQASSKQRTPLPCTQPRTSHPKRADEPANSSDDADDTGPRVYFCHARFCTEFFTSLAARAAHARDHEHDADQEHLAAYFYCCVPGSSCQFARPVFDDPSQMRPNPKTFRKDEMITHLRRTLPHVQLTEDQRKEERAVIVMRTRMARQNLGLSELFPDQTPLPAHAVALMPPPLFP